MNDKERVRLANQLRGFLMERCEIQCKKVFLEHPSLQSVGLLVAQYWNDEAEDAVQAMFVCSELEEPDIAAALRAYDGEDSEDGRYDGPDYVNLPSFTVDNRPRFYPRWDSNHAAIPAFAAYCTEGGSQCNPARENYTLYAIFYRDGRAKTVGEKLRPHLDGHPVEMLTLCLKVNH